LFEPAAAALRNRGMNLSRAAGIVLVTGLAVVAGGLGLIVQTFISQFDTLSTQVTQAIDQIQTWLA
jgi:predicted PurR-regulated permease PerM